jgi:hypothetical protein
MTDPIQCATELLRPIWRHLLALVLHADVMHVDGTSLPVRDRDHPNGIVTGALWGYVGDESCAVYLYTSTGKKVGQREGELGPGAIPRAAQGACRRRRIERLRYELRACRPDRGWLQHARAEVLRESPLSERRPGGGTHCGLQDALRRRSRRKERERRRPVPADRTARLALGRGHSLSAQPSNRTAPLSRGWSATARQRDRRTSVVVRGPTRSHRCPGASPRSGRLIANRSRCRRDQRR